ncbi:hypothetical protein AB3S75_045332 [Citrus x aurantiifolia]
MAAWGKLHGYAKC